MAIPGSYHPPEVPGTTPVPTPTPTPTPTPGGTGPGPWWGRLFGDTANLPDWLKNLLGGAGGGTMPQPNQPATTTGFGWGRPYNPNAPAWNFPTQTGPYVPHGWAAKFIPAGAFQAPPGADATTPGSPDGTVGAADWERLRRMGLVNGGTVASAAGGGSALLGGGGGGGGTAASSAGGGGTGLGSSGGSGWASFFGLR